MNISYNPLHLVNAYGAFGSVTKQRYEIVVEGTNAEHPSEKSDWRAYEFKGKPGDPRRTPPVVAPYHLRLDWMIWFIPFSLVHGGRFVGGAIEHWFVRFVAKLLAGDRAVAKLLRTDPFPKGRPRFIRVHLYRYSFTSRAERRATGAWWNRTFVAELLPPSGLAPPRRDIEEEIEVPLHAFDASESRPR